MDTAARHLLLLEDLLTLRREGTGQLAAPALRKVGLQIESFGSAPATLDDAIRRVRQSIRPDVLLHFERAAAKYGRALASSRNGVCHGCFTRLPTSRQGPCRPDGIRTCPNCGRVVYRP
jgi:predicted  nucleic acid-binding Zn-ribbon protein